MFLAASVFFAIQDAVLAARKAAGDNSLLYMDTPATCEHIRMACTDHLTQQVRLLQIVVLLATFRTCYSRTVL